MKIALVIVLFTYGSLSAQRADAAVAADSGVPSERDWIPRRCDGPRTEPRRAEAGPNETLFGIVEMLQSDERQPPHKSESAGAPLDDPRLTASMAQS